MKQQAAPTCPPSTLYANLSNDLVDSTTLPNFAIVRIPEHAKIVKLFTLLMSNGFPEVSFVNEIRENAFLPAVSPMRDLNNMVEISSKPIEKTCEIIDDGFGPSSIAESVSTNSTLTNAAVNSPRIPSPISYVARPRGPRPMVTIDAGLFAVCQLCQNKIMSSRMSNLTNHVRRHASLKQFQCVHCAYAHNEMAKVRLHMQHNHKDFDSQPLDILTPEMQCQWNTLMKQCFPDNAKADRSGNNDCKSQRKKSAEERLNETIIERRGVTSPKANGFLLCIECGVYVDENQLVDHLASVHEHECTPYICGECSFVNADEWKIRLHTSLYHAEKTTEVEVMKLNVGSHLNVFVPKYFPEIRVNMDEILMMNQFQDSSIKNEDDNSESGVSGTANQIFSGIACKLCDEQLPDSRSLSSIMNHAQRHYQFKQYQCSECKYASSQAAHVRTHMTLKHPQVFAKPVVNNETLQNAWIDTMRNCFPELVSRIDRFRLNKSQVATFAEQTPVSKSSIETPRKRKSTGKFQIRDMQIRQATKHVRI